MKYIIYAEPKWGTDPRYTRPLWFCEGVPWTRNKAEASLYALDHKGKPIGWGAKPWPIRDNVYEIHLIPIKDPGRLV